MRVVKNSPPNAGDVGDLGLIPGLGRPPGRGHGNPLQYFCLENSMDRRAWRATIVESQRVGCDSVTGYSRIGATGWERRHREGVGKGLSPHGPSRSTPLSLNSHVSINPEALRTVSCLDFYEGLIS